MVITFKNDNFYFCHLPSYGIYFRNRKFFFEKKIHEKEIIADIYLQLIEPNFRKRKFYFYLFNYIPVGNSNKGKIILHTKYYTKKRAVFTYFGVKKPKIELEILQLD